MSLLFVAALLGSSTTGYDVRGAVLGLTGRAQPGVAVQAMGAGAAVADQTLTDAAGAYHLRGLAEGKEYAVKVSAEGTTVSPAELKLTMASKDVEDADFMLFRPPAGRAVCGTVEVEEGLRASSALRVELHGAGAAEGAAPIASAPIDASCYFEFTVPVQSGDDFVLRLQSNISTTAYAVSAAEHPVSFGGAGKGSLVCTATPMVFTALRRRLSDAEVAPPALTLLCLVVAIAAYFKREALAPHAAQLFEASAKQMPFLKNGFINLNRAVGERQAGGKAGLNGKRRKR